MCVAFVSAIKYKQMKSNCEYTNGALRILSKPLIQLSWCHGLLSWYLGLLSWYLGLHSWYLGLLSWCSGLLSWCQKFSEMSRCKYSGIILRSDLNWLDQVNYTAQKALKTLHFVMRVLKKGNRNTKSLTYTSLVHPILQYGSACWDLCRQGQINALDRVQKKAAQFTNHTMDS